MNIEERARQLRATIESLSSTLDDESALDNKELFPSWIEGKEYQIDDRVRHNDDLYRCVQSHISTPTWNPLDAVSLWALVLTPDPTIVPEWVQPESTNPYMIGDRVMHNGKMWESTIDYNVFEPGIAGWIEVT